MFDKRWLYLLFVFLVTGIAIFYVWLRVEQIRYGYMISDLYEQYLEQLTTNRKLKLEWHYLTSPVKLEEIARNEFSMRPPKPEEIIYVEIPRRLIADGRNP